MSMQDENGTNPPPIPNASVPVWEQVIEDMRKRDEFGAKKYRTRLQAHNNRNPLQDLYEELLDSAVYLKQAIIEGRFVIEQLPAKEPEKMFPLQTSRGEDVKPGPIQIPWSIAEKAYGAYARAYGRGQSLERLAERGGFEWYEMDMLYPQWREECDELAKLRAENEKLRKQIEAKERETRNVLIIESENRMLKNEIAYGCRRVPTGA